METEAKICEACSKPVEPEAQRVSYSDKHWHAECFSCYNCEKPLMGQHFIVVQNHRVCSVECKNQS